VTSPAAGVRWAGGHAVVTMPAEIDLVNAAALGSQLAALTAQSPQVITADLTATRYCDSAGIHALARAHQHAAAAGIELRLVTGPSPVTRLLQLTGLDQVIPRYPGLPESLATPRQHPPAP
jgi:anti-anti-sigma factor